MSTQELTPHRGTARYRERRRLSPGVLLIYLAVMALLLAVGWYAGTRSTEERRTAVTDEIDTSGQLTDSFERPNTALPAPLDGAAAIDAPLWAPLGSGFELTPEATARVAANPVGEKSMALTNPEASDVTVLATVANAPQGAGVVFRFQDVFNHWSLISAPDFGTWNLVQVVNGEPAFSQGIGLSSNTAGTDIAISVDGPSIRIFVDGNPALALVDPTFQQATTVGLVGLNGSGAAFDEFTVVANDLTLAPAVTSESVPGDG